MPSRVLSQDASIRAEVNKTTFSTDELVILTVTISDDSAQQPRPILPQLAGLAVVDLDLATSVDTVNGKIYTEVIYTYRLQPRQTGSLTIPPVAVEIDGKRFESPAISIKVTQGSAPAPSPGNGAAIPEGVTPPAGLTGQDFFVESVVDIPRPYLNQQLIHTFRFYQAIQLYKKPNYEEPLFPGFEKVGLPVRQYNLEVASRIYLITEIRTILFPKNSGRLTIQPARLVLLGNYYEEPVELYTEPVGVEVQPLPGGAPPGFQGAVGQYQIKSWFSPAVAVINQPATFYVAVSGMGNIAALPEPVWPQIKWWRAYDTLTSLTTELKNDELMTGTRVFERLVVPGQLGEQTVLPAALVYFDPIAAEYRTIESEPVSIEIIEAPTPVPITPTAVAAVATEPAPEVTGEPQPALPDAVSRDFSNSSGLSSWSIQVPVLPLVLLALCGAIPLAALAGAGGVWLWQQRHRPRTAPVTTSPPVMAQLLAKLKSKSSEAKLQPAHEALKPTSQMIHPVLAEAMKEGNDNYRTIQRAFTHYFEVKLARPVKGLTRTELVNHLRTRGLTDSLLVEVEHCLAECEIGRYSPAVKDAGWSLMATVDQLLFKLDQVFNESTT